MSLQIELISRRGCSICDKMKAMLVRLCEEQSQSFTELDVDRDPGLFLYYTHRVPVLMVNGKPVADLNWDEQSVRKILASQAASPASH